MSWKNLLVALLLAPAAAAAQPSADWIKAPNAAAEFVTEPVFGGQVALFRAGPSDGEVVVLVHGLGKNAARDWEKTIPALAQRYSVYALDLPGFGHSGKGNHLYSPENFARVIEGVLGERVQRAFTLVGHSMGGAVALAYTAAYPQRVSRLVLVDAAGVLHRSVYGEFLGRVGAQRAIGMDSPWFEQVVRAIQLRVENWPIHGKVMLEREGVRRRLFGGDPNAIAAFALVEHDFSQALRSIKAPTLVIWGAQDSIAPPRTGQALGSAIRGARLVVLEGIAHAPQIEAPERFNPILLDEIDGRPLAAPPYALPEGDPASKRNGSCTSSRRAEFTGDYERVVLDNCAEATITNARIGYLQVAHSTLRIVNSHVRQGIDAKNARIELTGGSVRGHMVLDATSVDAAATRFADPRVATNAGDIPVVLRFSVAEMSGSGNEPWSLHNIRRLAPGETLIR